MPKALFNKILIANRGEIAVRVIRACREMSIGTVAVFSDADRAAEHVLMADEAYPIGPAASSQSYLRIEKVAEVAQRSGADALHPGYGFLAENPALARACKVAGVVFIGPTAEAMELMGSKTAARMAAERAGVPTVPGTRQPLQSADEARELARKWGYPVLLKAVAGGGGKGMRVIRDEKHLAGGLRDAQSEALNAFGDAAVYLEKYLERPRHIEIQVLGDTHGNLIHLGERECSIQRRHQKLVEECPSPIMTAALRQAMGAAAVKIAKAGGYTNAGTVEFLVVPSEKNETGYAFFFLEMNTRLQVEHPVTEQVTGLDLVKEQIRVAAGEELGLRQEEIEWRGAAVEVRIYAEDPQRNFLPCPGRVTRLHRPAGPGVRVDGAVYEGWTVPMEYDPLLAKLICWGGTRAEALARLRRALGEYQVGGLRTNLPFFQRLLEREEFQRGELDTELVDRMLTESPMPTAQDSMDGVADAAAISLALNEMTTAKDGVPRKGAPSRWKMAGRGEALRGLEKRRP